MDGAAPVAAENEANVRYLLDTHGACMRLVDTGLAPGLGGSGLEGAHPDRHDPPEVWLTQAEAALVRRFDPRGDTIGFFVAKFEKAA
eukprot:365303-Chlamydomonas_euryale.AAC.64